MKNARFAIPPRALWVAAAVFFVALYFLFQPTPRAPGVKAAGPAPYAAPDLTFPGATFAQALKENPPLALLLTRRKLIESVADPGQRAAQWEAFLVELEKDSADHALRGLARLKLGEALAGGDQAKALEQLCHAEVLRSTALGDLAFERIITLVSLQPALAREATRRIQEAGASGPENPEIRYRWISLLLASQQRDVAARLVKLPGGGPAAWGRVEQAALAFSTGKNTPGAGILSEAWLDTSVPAAWDEVFALTAARGGKQGVAAILSPKQLGEAGQAWVKRQDFHRAWRCFAAISARGAQKLPIDMQLSAAWAAYRVGQSGEALRRLNKMGVLRGDPEADRNCLAALCANKQRQDALFAKYSQKAFALGQNSPHYPAVVRAAAFEAELAGDLESVRKFYLIIAMRSDSPETRAEGWWKTAWADYATGRYDLADAGFLKAQTEDPGKEFGLAALYWHGVCSLRRGEAAEALAVFTAISEVFPFSYYAELSREQETRLTGVGRDPHRAAHWRDALLRKYFPKPKPTWGEWFAKVSPADRAFLLQAWAAGYRRWVSRRLLALGGDQPARDVYSLLYEVYAEERDTFQLIRNFNRAWPEAFASDLARFPRAVWEGLYPDRYRQVVEAEIAGSGLDPFLILSLIRQESAFREDVRSSSNAVGLMQLLPSTAAVEARWRGRREALEKKLEEPDFNIRLGCSYFRKVLRMMEGRLPLALGGYNGGPGRLAKVYMLWGGRLSMEEVVEMIPMAESRNYVKAIFRNYNYYSCLYRGRPAPVRAFLEGRVDS